MQIPNVRVRSKPLALAVLFFAISIQIACEGGVRSNRTSDESWAHIESQREALTAARALLASPGVPPSEAILAAQSAPVSRAAEALHRLLIAYLNENPPRAGERLSPRTAQAIQWKTELDQQRAREYLDHGDPARAIEILESALVLLPKNQAIAEALIEARTRRYLSAERFALVKEGMKSSDVEKALGVPNPHDVREFADQGVIAWFYPKDASGAAAAVWFEKKTGGELEVYRLDFEAIGAEGKVTSAR